MMLGKEKKKKDQKRGVRMVFMHNHRRRDLHMPNPSNVVDKDSGKLKSPAQINVVAKSSRRPAELGRGFALAGIHLFTYPVIRRQGRDKESRWSFAMERDARFTITDQQSRSI